MIDNGQDSGYQSNFGRVPYEETHFEEKDENNFVSNANHGNRQFKHLIFLRLKVIVNSYWNKFNKNKNVLPCTSYFSFVLHNFGI